MKLLIKYPTRGRPVWFIKTLDLYMRMLSGLHEVEFMIAMDIDDPTMRTDLMADYLAQIEPPEDSLTKLTWYWREHAGKVEAVNSCIASKDFDIVVVISDDIEPTEVGYDNIIVQHMRQYYPDLNGLLYFDDGRCGSHAITIPVIGREMYRKMGNIVHPDFVAWGDNYTTAVLKPTPQCTYVDRPLLQHHWKKYILRNKQGRRIDATSLRAAHLKMTDRRTANRLLKESKAWNVV